MKDIITATNHTSFTVASLDTAIPLFCEGLDFVLTSRAGRDPQSIQTITGVEGAAVEIAYMRRPEVTLKVALGLGTGRDRVLTCDLTKEYVTINGDYRS